MQHLLTWDTGIIAAFGILLAYSLIIRKHKSLATLVSVYIAYVAVVMFGSRAVEFFGGQRVIMNQIWITAQTSPVVIKAGLMIGIALLLSSSMKLGGRRSRYSTVEVVVYAVATLAVAVACVLNFMDPAQQAAAIASSKIVPYIAQWREWIIGAPIVLMIIFGLYFNEEQ